MGRGAGGLHIAAYSRCEWVAARSCLEPLIRTVICVKTSEAGPLIVVTHHDTLCVEARGGADVIVRYVERDCRQIPETHLVSMFGWSRVAIDIVNSLLPSVIQDKISNRV